MVGGKKISDLRVVDLRAELERRGLDKSGFKAVLIERLGQAIDKEGGSKDNFVVGEDLSKEKSFTKSDTEEGEEVVNNIILMESPLKDQNGASPNESFVEQEGQETVAVMSEILLVDDPDIVDDEFSVEPDEPASVQNHEVKSSGNQNAVVEMGTEISDAEEIENKEIPPEKIVVKNNEPDIRLNVLALIATKTVEHHIETVENLDSNTEQEIVLLPETMTSDETENKEVSDDNQIILMVDEDHDALNITIDEEEEADKFMMGEEVEYIVNTVEKIITKPELQLKSESGGDSEVPDKEDESCKENSEEIGVKEPSHGATTTMEEVKSSEDSTNHISSSSKDVKGIDKPEEGGIQQNPKDEELNTLLVTGLSSQTAATDLKNVFKKHGKIGGVKIMTNSKDPDGSRFALVAVLSPEDVIICIAKLDGYELHGRIIHVEKAGDDMLTADWSRKEGNRDISSGPGKKLESDKKDVKVKTEENKGSEPTLDKGKSTKRSQEKSTTKAVQGSVKSTPSRSDTRRKSSNSNADKSNDKGTKAKPFNTRSTESTTKKNVVRPVREKKELDRKVRRDITLDNFARRHQGRVERNPRYAERQFVRHQPEGRDFSRHHFANEERGREIQRRFHGPGAGVGPHGRNHSPARRSPFRRPSAESRRTGRQPELTFEDIYDIREREKRRELDRERREAERRRQEDEEKQRLLDQEIRMLARQRERIEQEKLELKRQKERIIMVEREKQREERERLHREKEEMQRRLEEGRRASKRSHGDESYDIDRKKPALDERSRHIAPFVDTHSRPEKDKLRTEVYRRPEVNRYKALDDLPRRSLTPVRGAPMRNAPVRDSRAPTWDNDRERGVRERTPERLTHREREPLKVSRSDDRRDERKPFPLSSTTEVPRYSHEAAGHYGTTVAPSTWGSRHTEGKNETYVNSSIREDRWPVRSSSTFNSDAHTSQLQAVSRNESWQSGREPSWSSSERIVSRPLVEMPDRWVTASGNAISSTGRLPLPVAPPPPIFSSPTGTILLNPSEFSNARYEYDYSKLQSMQRR